MKNFLQKNISFATVREMINYVLCIGRKICFRTAAGKFVFGERPQSLFTTATYNNYKLLFLVVTVAQKTSITY